MVISNIKELSKLIDLCRKKGIDALEIDNIKFKLGPLEPKIKDRSPDLSQSAQVSGEDLLFWSSNMESN